MVFTQYIYELFYLNEISFHNQILYFIANKNKKVETSNFDILTIQTQRNITKSCKQANEIISYSKTKKISKYNSLKENKQKILNPRYTKYVTNSFKQNRRHSIDQFKTNENLNIEKQCTNDDNSIQFLKPLKTSTVVCLTDLKNIVRKEVNDFGKVENKNSK